METDQFRQKFQKLSRESLAQERASLAAEWHEPLAWLHFAVNSYFTLPAFFSACEQAGLGARQELLMPFTRIPTPATLIAYRAVAASLAQEGFPPF